MESRTRQMGAAAVLAAIAAAAGCNVAVRGGGEDLGGQRSTGSGGDRDQGSTGSSGQGGAGLSTGASGCAGGAGASTGEGGGGVESACPSGLVGVNWTGTAWQVARMDPTTAGLTVLGPVPAGAAFAQGFSAYDPVAKRIYQIGNTWLGTIDAVTGAVIGTATLPDLTIYNPEVNAAGELVVVHGAKMAKIDPATGAVTDLAPLPFSDGFEQAISTFDRATNRIYQFAPFRLVVVDGSTGATISVVTLPDQNFLNPVVNNAGEILGVHLTSGAAHVARVDPATGVITDLAPLPYAGGYTLGMSTFDRCDNRMIQLGDGFVLTIDGATGAVISLVPTTQKGFVNTEAAW